MATRFTEFNDDELEHMAEGLVTRATQLREQKAKPAQLREVQHLDNEIYQELFKRNRGGR